MIRPKRRTGISRSALPVIRSMRDHPVRHSRLWTLGIGPPDFQNQPALRPGYVGIAVSTRLRDDYRFRTVEPLVSDEPPSGAGQPFAGLVQAVHVAVGAVDRELPGHQRGDGRLDVSRIGPVV